jgi:hypothetical protein
VTRAGWYGTAPRRRQRWLCEPRDGGRPHRFTELLPRLEAAQAHCSECSTLLDAWEGQTAPRTYVWHARQIAATLLDLSRGATYRDAARRARQAAGRVPRTKAGMVDLDRAADGQLAANWVDVFADVITAPRLPDRWPRVLVVDSVEFRLSMGPRAGEQFHIFCAMGADSRRLLPVRIEPFPDKSKASWDAFFASLPDTPKVIVSDMDGAIAKSISASFPRDGAPAPEHRLSEFHVKRSLGRLLPDELIKGDPPPPLGQAFEKALTSFEAWDAFLSAVNDAEDAGYEFRALHRWLDKYGTRLGAQAGTRNRHHPNSTGAVENQIRGTLERCLGNRASRLGNRARLCRLLDLICVEQRGDANEVAWAEDIRTHLLSRAGRADRQRQHDDERGRPSLYAPVAPRPTPSSAPTPPTEPAEPAAAATTATASDPGPPPAGMTEQEWRDWYGRGAPDPPEPEPGDL